MIKFVGILRSHVVISYKLVAQINFSKKIPFKLFSHAWIKILTVQCRVKVLTAVFKNGSGYIHSYKIYVYILLMLDLIITLNCYII